MPGDPPHRAFFTTRPPVCVCACADGGAAAVIVRAGAVPFRCRARPVPPRPLLRAGGFSGRFDRFLLKSEAWRPKTVTIVGKTQSPEGPLARYLSDHYGLAAVLQLRPSA